MQGLKNIKPNKSTIQSTYSKSSQITTNNFDFLMQSIQRDKYINQVDKENYQNNEGRYSIKVRPVRPEQSHMTRSTLVNPFLQQKQVKQKEGANISQLLESMIYKVKKYISITEPMLQNQNKIEDKFRKQGINTACQLIQIVTQMQQNNFYKKINNQSLYSSLNSTGNLAIGANQSLSSSHHFSNGLSSPQNSVNFIRKIENLQEQKMHLESLISQHERANIKMFIKLNEGQSEEIQRYKKQLSSLYQKYKQLQKLVKKQSQKSRNLQLKLDESKSASGCGKLCQLNNSQMRKKILNSQQIINEQNDCIVKALQQINTLKERLQGNKYREIELLHKIGEMEKLQKSRQVNKFSLMPNRDLGKSSCSDAVMDPICIKNNKSPNVDVSDLFSNINVKPNYGFSPKREQDLFRILLAQASAIDRALKK